VSRQSRIAPGRRRKWLCLLGACILLSLVLHVAAGGWLAFRSREAVRRDHLVWIDIAPPEPALTPPPASALPEKNIQPAPPPDRPVVRKAAQARPAPVAGQAVRERGNQAARDAVAPQPAPSSVPASQPPTGQPVARPGVTVLANESGQDALKHGAEARFMHGLATEEFVEENYIGAYSLGAKGRVWIEDDRARSGHLVLHAEHLGLIRPLFRYNRFIYVYGERPDAPDPILGTVTFFSDGYHIHQFLWQHNSTHAYYPRRIPE
jgi:hypothetical protein